MTKAEKFVDDFTKLVQSFDNVAPTPSEFNSQYQKQVAFFDKIYRDAYQEGVNDSVKIGDNLSANK